MIESNFKDSLSIQKRRLWQQNIVIALQALGLVVLAIILLTRQEQIRTVIVPMHSTETFWVDNEHVSESYLSDMASYIMELYLTVTGETLESHRHSLLKLTAPESEGELNRALSIDAKKIKHEHLSTAFYAKTTQVDMEKMQVLVAGTLERFTAQHRLPTKKVKYSVNFRLNHGRLWLVGIEDKTKGEINEL